MIQKMSGRRLLAVSLLLLVSAVSCVAPRGVDRIAAPYSEDTLRYHLETLAKRVTSKLQSTPEAPRSVKEELELVEEYFILNGQIKRLDKELSLGAQTDTTLTYLSDQVAWARQRRDSIRDQVEGIITRQVGEALQEAGLGPADGSGGAGGIFPPSAFFLLKPPFVLVTSPRERIEISASYLLASELSPATIEDIERQVESEGQSALVEVTGGFSLYPAWVAEDDSLRHTLEVVAHEWTHAYLFIYFPLGRAYFEDHQMRTINETVADIVGREAGEAVYRRYYAARETPQPQLMLVAARERQFDYAQRMRGIRATVEGMLADGRVQEAESYMEAERGRLAARGYYLRRLNQAYLALHGTYADNPAFENPIGTILKDIRSKSRSLGDFIRKVGPVSSYADFHELTE